MRLLATKFAGLLVMMSLSACVGTRDVEPLSITVSGDAQKIASCTFRGVDADTDYENYNHQLHDLADNGVSLLTGDLRACGGLLARCATTRMWEIEFIPAPNNMTHLLIKDHPSLYGDHYWWREAVKPKVDKCVQRLG